MNPGVAVAIFKQEYQNSLRLFWNYLDFFYMLFILNLDQNLYSKEVIFKCIYWYLDEFNITVNLKAGLFEISVQQKNNRKYSDVEIEALKSKINQDLNDFNLRDIITKETTDIRKLLIAKAFSPFDTEEEPP